MKLSASTPFKSTLKASSGLPSSFNKKKAAPSKEAPKKKPRVLLDEDEDDFDMLNPVSHPVPAVQNRSPVPSLTGSMSVSIPEGISVTTEVMLDESLREDNTDRYKNQSINTAVMSQPTELKTHISKKKIRGLTTMFGQRADIILDLLEDDSQTDGALTLIQRTLLQTMVDVLPVVERAVRTSRGKRGVYQLNQCISQIRELTTDIQSLRDRGQLGAAVVERVLRPAFLDLAVQISTAITHIGESSKLYMKEEDYAKYRSEVIMPATRTLAKYVHDQYEDVRTGVTAGLS